MPNELERLADALGIATTGPGGKIVNGQPLTGVGKCPYCGVANPFLGHIWSSQHATSRVDGGAPYQWGAYLCSTCGSVVAARGPYTHGRTSVVEMTFPSPRVAHSDIPQPARDFLQEAFNVLSAPNSAAMAAGSAVDAMLKANGLEEGSLYARIDQAVGQHLLTKGMGEWAHSVRLGSNRPRHADKDHPLVTPDEARQSVEFAEALGQFLFVLTAKITKGIAADGGSTPQTNGAA